MEILNDDTNVDSNSSELKILNKLGSESLNEYNKNVQSHRVKFLFSEENQFFTGETDCRRLQAFLLVWTGLSIEMTKGVEDWIRRAGQKCQSLSVGLDNIGGKLLKHSVHEANHDKMLVDDLEYLVKSWNEKFKGSLTSEMVRSIGNSTGTQEYVALHENVINGPKPFCQAAIEFEIERLSVYCAPWWVQNVLASLGAEYSSGMSFLEEHILLDGGHTRFNSILIQECLTVTKDLESLVTTAKAALSAYNKFLSDCIRLSATL